MSTKSLHDRFYFKNRLFAAALMLTGICFTGELQAQTITNIYNTAGTNTFVIPANVTQMVVQTWGGGGGANGTSGTGDRPGGGGGAYASSTLAVTSGASYSVIVGAGGAEGNPAASGGNSLIRIGAVTNVLAAGGTGAQTTSAAGAGGTVAASIGVTRFAGGTGGANPSTGGGGGGGSAFATSNGLNGADASGATGGAGGAGTGAGGNGGNANAVGLSGNAPGGGGGGRGDNGGTSGGGAVGRVVIVYTVSSVVNIPAKLVFTNSPQSIFEGAISGLLTVQLQTTNNIPANATNNVTVNLSSSPSGTFRNSANTSNITSIVISNGQQTASFRFTSSTLGTSVLTAAASGLTSATQNLVVVQQNSIVQTYYVPFDEDGVYRFLQAINAANTGPTNVAVLSVSCFASNTVIYYDHWEDGYEADLSTPTQSTTEVWGNLTTADGCPPNGTNAVVCSSSTNDFIRRGQVVFSFQEIDIPRTNSVIRRDGRDKIGVTRPVAFTRSGWNRFQNTLMAGSIEVADTAQWGQRYQMPIGTNVVIEGQSFERVGFSVMARTNSTVVRIDLDNNGTFETTTNLNEGQTYNVTNGVIVGSVITSSAPVQVHISAGENVSAVGYLLNWYSVTPVNKFGSEYYNPVGTTLAAARTDVILYNPNTNSISVIVEFSDGEEIFTETKVISAGGFAYRTNTLLNAAQRYYSTNGSTFYGIGVVDAATGDGGVWDWGFSLVPVTELTPVFLVGWAPGRDPLSGTNPNTNVSPVWVSAVEPTTIYVDYDGDGGTLTNDCGTYDLATNVGYLASVKIYDPDGDQSGMKVFTCDGTLLTAAWGEDPSIAPQAAPSLDIGTTILPLPSIGAKKTVDFTPGGDLDGNGFLNPGEFIRYTVTITNPNLSVSGGIIALDDPPEEWLYVTNSSRLNFTNTIPDSGTTPFPFDEAGYDVGVLAAQSSLTLSFDGMITNPYLSARTVLTNAATVYDDVSTIVLATEVSTPIYQQTLIIDKQSDALVITNNQIVTYTISVLNTSQYVQVGVAVTDAVPPSVSFITGTVFVTAPQNSGSIFTNTIRDDFSVTNYFINTGSGRTNWINSWTEVNDGAGVSNAGLIQISNQVLQISGTNGVNQPSIYRSANLSNSLAAILTYRFVASNDLETIDSLIVDLSTNNGSSFLTLSNHTGFSGWMSGTGRFDITSQATTNTRVRFRVNSGYRGTNEYFRVDWVQIQYVTGSSVRVTNTFAGTAPPVLHSNQTLLAGESMTITFQARATNNLTGIANITNRACVVVEGASASCDNIIDPVLMPAGLRIVKTVSKGPYPGSDLEFGTNGTPVTYWFVVSNTGTVPLVSVQVNDPDLAFFNNIGNLAVGQSVTVSAADVISGLLTNTATVTGVYLGNTYTNSDIAVVSSISPDISLQKTVSANGTFGSSGELVTGTNGQIVTYFFVVANEGNTALTNVVVTDNNISPVLSTNIGTLAVNQTRTISVTRAISGDLLNTASVIGYDPLGGNVTANDTAEVDAINPDINIEKTVSASGTFTTSVESVTGTNNQPVTYYFVVSNPGNVTLTNAYVLDTTLSPVFSNFIGTLTAGQSVTLSTARVISGDLLNTASTFGRDQLGNTQSDSDTASVDSITPAISIAKTVSDIGASPGVETVTGTNNQPVLYSFVILNTGDVTLTNVTVTDTLVSPSFSTNVGTLTVGQSRTVTASRVILNSLTNRATGAGTPPVGPPVSSTDTSVVLRINPAITIAKTVSDVGASPGVETVTGTNNQPVLYSFVVLNTGDVTLTNVTVTDTLVSPSFSTNIGTLTVGQSRTVTASRVILNSLTNTATGAGTPPVGAPVTSTDTSVVLRINPAITIAKTVSDVGASPGVETVTGTNNQPVLYSFVVLNTGDVTLTNVTVNDTFVSPTFTTNVGTLLVGQSRTVTAGRVILNSLTNRATGAGTPPIGPPVSNTDTSVVLRINPAITIAKTVSDVGASPGVETVTGTNNQPVLYSFVVLNTGDVTLTNVTVNDTFVSPTFSTNIGTLTVGQSRTVTASRVILNSLTNTATGAGTPPVGPPVSNTDTSVVLRINPAITIAKTVSDVGASPGVETVTGTNNQPVLYSFVVLNTGDVTLTNVTVNDTFVTPTFTTNVGTLLVGQSRTVTAGRVILNSLTNRATGAGTPPVGPPVSNTDTSVVLRINPAITIAKTVSDVGASPGVETVTGTNNQPVLYSFVVLNTGDVTLTNVTVNDTFVTPTFTTNVGTLLVGQSRTVTAGRVILNSLTNRATGAGTPPVGPPVSNTDTSVVLRINPAITIAKTVSDVGASPGVETVTGTNNQPVLYSFVVLNTGDVTLTNVTVTDTFVSPTFSTNVGTLAVGQSRTVTASRVILNSLTNTATGAGTPPVGPPVSNTDTSVVLRINPAFTLAKTVSDVGASPGVETVTGTNNQPVLYSFVVQNTGDVTLTNVTVNDTFLTPTFSTNIGTLAVGQSYTVTANRVILNSLTNTATGAGTPPVGPPITRTDTSVVLRINPDINLEKTVSADGTFASSGELVTGTNNQPVTYFFVVSNNGDVTLTNVTVVDTTITPAYTNVIGTLTAGQSATVSVATVISSDLTNTATATGVDQLGNTHDDSDTAEVALIAPNINLEKTVSADGTFASSGELVTGTNNQPVTYFFVVSNNGDVTLTNVTVVDTTITPAYTNVIGSLAAGQSVTVSVNDVISSDLTNTATATGVDQLGNTHDDTDTAEVALIAPNINLEKTVSADGTFASSGELVTGTNNQPVTYFFVVSNNGDVTLTNVTVVDTTITPAYTNVIGTLAAGQSVTVSVNDVISVDLTNTATATGVDQLGNTHDDSDTAEVALISPNINLEKTVSADGTFASSGELVTGTNNQPVTYFFVVSNNGDVTLTNVTVVDTTITPAYTNVIGTLASGASATVSVASVISTDLINTATATGVDQLGNTHDDTDTAAVSLISPDINLEKTVSANGTFASSGELVTGTNNQPVTYFFVVSNNGDVTLTNVTLVDTTITPAYTNVIGTLASGQSVTVSTATVISSDLTNTATVTGIDQLGNTFDDTDTAEVAQIAPDINLEKTVSADGTFASSGELVTGTNNQPVTYFFVVSNNGDVTLTNVTVVDTTITPAYTNVIGTLAAGQSTTVSVTTIISSDLTNTATATGVDQLGNTHDDTDTAEVALIAPNINLEKTVSADGTFASSGELVTGTNNQPVTYFFVVSNNGDVTLTNVTVVDVTITPAYTNVIGTLAAGQSVTVSVNDVISSDLTNTATATGVDQLGNTHDDTDTAEVALIAPNINLEKTVSADGTFASSGELVNGTNNQPVTYFFVVSNNGDVTLTNVTVVDTTITPAYTNVIGTLAAGQSVTVSVNDVISSDLTNTATATGVDPLGNTHDDTDTAEVALIAPNINLEKTVSADGTFASSGELVTGTNNQPVTYFFVVSNNGDVTLTNVTVVDTTITPAYTNVIGTLVSGASATVSVATVISSDLTNTATATGVDQLGNTHDDTDTAEVALISPDISIVKTVSSDGNYPGSDLVVSTNGTPVTYWFLVSNLGDVTLTNVTVVDNTITPNYTNVIGTLAAGQVVTVSVADVISVNLTNTATVTGVDQLGNTHDDDDTAEVAQVMKISGSVFVDVNADGIFDPEDTNGIGNVTIVLLDSMTNVIATTNTTLDGYYEFLGLPPGTYTVVEIDPPGFFSTSDVVPPNDNRIPVTLVSGVDVTGRDFLDAQNPDPSINKSFLSTTALDTNGNFAVSYRITIINPAVSAVIYDLSDTPDPDPNVTITGGTVSGFASLTLSGPGPYTLATNAIIAANSTNEYILTLNAVLDADVLGGFTNVTSCNTGIGGFSANEGLFNEVTITYGTNDTTVTTNACGNIPPWIVPVKTFVSASEPDTNGNFIVNYSLTVENHGGRIGTYDLTDTPDFDGQITVLSNNVSGQITQGFAGSGPYTLATGTSLQAAEIHTYLLAVYAQLSVSVLNGTTNVSLCDEDINGSLAGQGLYNEATVVFATNSITITTDACGDVPPLLIPTKTFVSATAPDLNGNFIVTYNVTVENTGGTEGSYDLTDTPDMDGQITVLSNNVSGQISTNFTGAGPYTLASGTAIAAAATHTYTLTMYAQLSTAVLNGTTNVSLCELEVGEYVSGQGLYNEATLVYGTNDTTITVEDCGDVPPLMVINKTFVSASAPDTNGNFVVSYNVTVRNTGGSAGPYNLTDTPVFDTNITVSGGSISGATNLTLTGGGPYILATNRNLGAGQTNVFALTLNAQLSLAVRTGATNVSDCIVANGTFTSGRGLYNSATITYGTNSIVISTNACGPVPPLMVINKTFVSASAPDTNGNFVVSYNVTVRNTGGSSGPYNLTDTPSFDTNITISGGAVTGATNLTLVGAGPYILATNRNLGAGQTNVFALTLNAQLSLAVRTGATNVSDCIVANGTFTSGRGLYNSATITYGTNSIVISTNACGPVPPLMVINKTFVSASAPDTNGNFVVSYNVTVRNTGGSSGPYNLTDTPSFDTNITISGGAVTGATNLTLVGAGPYTLATNRNLAAGATNVFALTLNAQLSLAVRTGATNVSDCIVANGTFTSGRGLYNSATITYGTNSIVISTNACGPVPPLMVINKTFVSASAPDTNGNFVVSYNVTVRNTGGSSGPYNLTDTPSFDTNITVSGGAVTGATNLTLVGAGPYTLATNRNLAAGATNIYALTLNAQLSLAVRTGSTNVSDCIVANGTFTSGRGLYNSATITYGTNSIVISTNACGPVPPLMVINKTFVSASAPDTNGNFVVSYNVTVRNTGGSSGPYNLTDTPSFDTNITISGGAVTGATNLTLVGAGPYILATNRNLGAGQTNVFALTLNAQLSLAVRTGSTNVSDCIVANGTYTSGRGLYNSATITYGTNSIVISTNACGPVPPLMVINKTFVSASAPDTNGNFVVSYNVTVRNTGGSSGPYNLTDTPSFDTNITVSGGNVTGATNLTLVGAGPYTLATNRNLAAGATNIYALTLNAQLSLAVRTGSTNVSDCIVANGTYTSGRGLYNSATITYGTNSIVISTNACGPVPPLMVINKTFVSASAPDTNGNFVVSYNVTVRNTGGSSGPYNLTDTPSFDTNITVSGGNVTGATNLTLVGAGPYTLATNRNLAAGATNIFALTLNAQLSLAVRTGSTNVSDCIVANGTFTSGRGLYNSATITYGTNSIVISTNACGPVPPLMVINKTFVSASAPDTNGNFVVSYNVTVRNTGGSSGPYNLTDTPSFDTNIMVSGGNVTGATNLTLVGAGPYTLATNRNLAAGATNIYALTLNAQLSLAVRTGSTNVSDCIVANGTFTSGRGLYNSATITYGTNSIVISTNACGPVPPLMVINKTFVSASEPDTNGNFVVNYNVTVRNTGGSSGPYNLTDTPSFDTNITVSGGNVTGATNLTLVGAGPYTLATNRNLAAGATNIYALTLNAQLSLAVRTGATNVSDCIVANGTYTSGRGLYNSATIVYGTNSIVISTNACGPVPPYLVPTKTFVSATEPDLTGNFVVTYNVTVENTGGTTGSYELNDTPIFDSNITVLSNNVTGQIVTNLTGAGPYILAVGTSISAGATHTYSLTIYAQLSVAVINGTTNISLCELDGNMHVAGQGLYNEATLTYGTNDTTITVEDCGDLPSYMIPTKTFVSASAPDTNGNFVVTYQVTVENTGGSTDLYDLTDTPIFDSNITVLSNNVTGQITTNFAGAGPYTLASGTPILAGATHTYTLNVYARLSAGVLNGSSSVSLCELDDGEYIAGQGLYNEATLVFGTNDTTVTVEDCGDVPPLMVINKTFVSASAPDTNGNFVVSYNVTVRNTGGSSGPYNLTDTPSFDTNITISGGAVTGATNLTLVGAGPYTLATNRNLAAGATNIYALTLNAQLSLAVRTGSTNVSDCIVANGTFTSGRGLYNSATITYGTNSIVISTNACGSVPPLMVINKTFVSASAPDTNGNFVVSYNVTVRNTGGSSGPYNLTDTPSFDTNITVSGGAVTGATNLTLVGAGPYTLATNRNLAAGATNVFALTLNAQLSLAVRTGATNVSDCIVANGTYTSGRGLYNSATITYGTNSIVISTNACGPVPPLMVINKTFVSASAPDTNGNFVVSYNVTVRNTGGSSGPYNLTDTPSFDTNITVSGGNVTGATNLTLVGAGPYTLATNRNLGAGQTNIYALTLNAQLSLAVRTGSTNVSDCIVANGTYTSGRGLYNSATITYGTNSIVISTNACGPVPPLMVINKAFVSASAPSTNGSFTVVYNVTVRNTGGSSGPYNLTDTPSFDTNITVSGGNVTGATNLTLTGGGPYTLATNRNLAAGQTNVFTITLNAQLSLAVRTGSTNLSECVVANGSYTSGRGLYNSATLTYGTNSIVVSTNDCGNVPPFMVIDKDFVSTSVVDGNGNFTVTYNVFVRNTGGSAGPYGLTDTPSFNTNITVLGGTVTGATNLALTGAGPYQLATNRVLGAGQTNVYTITLNARLSLAVMNGTTNISDCVVSNGTYTAGNGLFNGVRISYGTNSIIVTTNDCGNIPDIPRFTVVKTLVSPVGRPAIIGEQVVFRLSVSNNGEVGLGVVPLVDTYSTALLTYQNSSPASDDNVNDGAINWANVGPLGIGQSAVVTSRFIAVINGTGTNVVVATPVTTNSVPLNPQTSSVPHTTAAAMISGSVRHDVDGNADFGDPDDGIPGVTVTLLNSNSVVIGVTTTDVNGAYAFTNLLPGSYTVIQTDLPSFYSTADITAPNDNLIPLILVSGQNSTGNDFLDSLLAAVGDRTWLDDNINGIQDISEAGYPGIRVTLYTSNNVVIGITTSTASGYYTFTNVVPGTYYLRVNVPIGGGLVAQFQGTNTVIDNDFSPLNAITPLFTLLPGQNNTNIDAGLYNFQIFASIDDVSGKTVGGTPVLTWRTSTEHGTAGWYVERAGEDGSWTRVSGYLPAVGSPLEGARYAYPDTGALPGGTYRYRLVESEVRGSLRPSDTYTVSYPKAGRSTSASSTSAFSADVIPYVPVVAPAAVQTMSGSSGPAEAVKVTVKVSGLHKVTAAQIAGILGVSEASVAASPVRVEHLGVAVPAQRVGGDVVFHGESYQSMFTEQNVYRISLAQGVDAASQATTPAMGSPAVTYLDTLKLERQLILNPDIYENAADDIWLWFLLISDSINRFQFTTTMTLPNLAAGTGGELKVRVKGGSQTSGNGMHGYRVELNGQVLGHAQLFGLEAHEMTLPVAAGQWTTGANQLRVVSEPPAGVTSDHLYIDRFAATYVKTLAASTNRLVFTASAGPVKVTGFTSSSIDLWDVTDSRNPVRLSGYGTALEGATWSLNFTAPRDGRYAASSSNLTPVLSAWYGNDLKDNTHEVDYLVIHGAGLSAGAEALAADRTAKGLRTKVVSVESVFDAFNHGIPDGRVIKTFLSYAYRQWETGPRYVVLAGDSSLDYLNRTGAGDCLVPVAPEGSPTGVYGSDHGVGDVNGDGYLEMAVGRIPVTSASQLADYLAKLQSFEQGGAWRDNVMVSTDNPDLAGDYLANGDVLASNITTRTVERADIHYLGASGASDVLKDGLNEGHELTLYVGHGDLFKLAHESILSTNDVPSLVNSANPGVVMALGCLMGTHSQPGMVTIGEKLVSGQNGASAMIGCSTLVNNNDGNVLGNLVVGELYTAETPRLGDALVNAKNSQVGLQTHRGVKSYQLLGDPSLAIGDAQSPRGGPDVQPTRPSYGEWLTWAFPPVWLEQGLSTNPSDDPDKDGLTNWEEYMAGTDPLDALSDLVVVTVRPLSNGTVSLTWPSVPGRQYRIERASTITGAYSTIEDNVPSDAPVNSWVDTTPIGSAAFYRVYVK